MLYLVSTDEDAVRIQRDIQAANTIRNARGEAPLNMWVIVVTADADAADFAQAFDDGDPSLGSAAKPEYAIIDLRFD